MFRSAVICHAPQDARFARELGAFLEVNCPLTVSFQEGRDLMEAVERGLSDVTLALLSPDSAPRTWRRERWEPVLIQQPQELDAAIAFLLVRECKFPELLRRKGFFDLSKDVYSGRRALKRWLLGPERIVDLPPADSAPLVADFEWLRRRLADSPGCEAGLDAATALAFAHAAQGDFEGVFWIDCVYRSQAGILGDVASSLGLQLSGTLDQNAIALREFCDGRRCLFVFEGAPDRDRAVLDFGGKASVIFAAPPRIREVRPLAETTALFGAWTRNPDDCLRALGDARVHLDALLASTETWPGAVQLSASLIGLLKHYDRLAEAYEILDLMARAAVDRDDVVTLRRMAWEQSWILDHWDEPVSLLMPPPLAREPRQLTLEFGGI